LRRPASPIWQCSPRLLDRPALCEKNNNWLDIGEYQSHHHRIKTPTQDLFVLDAQYQQTDATLQQPNVCEEEDLRHPRQEIDMLVVRFREIPSMSAVPVFDGIDLEACSHQSQDAADHYRVVILLMLTGFRTTVVSARGTFPRACRLHRAHNLSIVLITVNDVKTHVRTSSIPPTDSSGGRGLGGCTADIGLARR
jgi:hypothetical protein